MYIQCTSKTLLFPQFFWDKMKGDYTLVYINSFVILFTRWGKDSPDGTFNTQQILSKAIFLKSLTLMRNTVCFTIACNHKSQGGKTSHQTNYENNPALLHFAEWKIHAWISIGILSREINLKCVNPSKESTG